MFKDFKEYVNENSGLANPAGDVRKYIIGLTNRLSLLRPEEIEEHRIQLARLQEVIGRKLQGEPNWGTADEPM